MRERMPATTRRGLLTAAVRYRRLPSQQRAGTLEALLELIRAFVLVRILGWSRYARTLGTARPGDADITWDGSWAEVHAVRRAVERWRRVLPGAMTCLISAIAGQRMLSRRDTTSAIVLGLRVADDDAGPLTAHAWLRAGDAIVLGGRHSLDFVAITNFSAPPTPR